MTTTKSQVSNGIVRWSVWYTNWMTYRHHLTPKKMGLLLFNHKSTASYKILLPVMFLWNDSSLYCLLSGSVPGTTGRLLIACFLFVRAMKNEWQVWQVDWSSPVLKYLFIWMARVRVGTTSSSMPKCKRTSHDKTACIMYRYEYIWFPFLYCTSRSYRNKND